MLHGEVFSGACAAAAGLIAHAQGKAPERGFEQPVLVTKVVRDEPRRHAGATRDVRERAADIANLGQAVDRDFDQLPAAVVAVVATRGPGH